MRAFNTSTCSALFKVLNRSEENKVYVSYEYLTASNMTFTAAERLKIKLMPRNMKKTKQKKLHMYYRNCYFENKPYNSAGFVVSVTSSVWLILLSIASLYSIREEFDFKTPRLELRLLRRKRLRTFASC